MTEVRPRLFDWQTRLAAWLSTVRKTPFKEGRHDCALFAAGAVQAMTGTDLAAAFRGRYRTTRGGLRVLRREGFADHIDLAARHFDEIAPSAAQPGDLVAVQTPEGLALGVVQGAAAYVPGRDGLALIPVKGASRAFRVA
jgi:hypothetical protein